MTRAACEVAHLAFGELASGELRCVIDLFPLVTSPADRLMIFLSSQISCGRYSNGRRATRPPLERTLISGSKCPLRQAHSRPRDLKVAEPRELLA